MMLVRLNLTSPYSLLILRKCEATERTFYNGLVL